MGDIGFSEMIVLVIVSILVFGKDLPAVARKTGRVLGKVRRYLTDVKEEVQRQIPLDDFDLRKDVDSALDDRSYRLPEPPAPADAPQPEVKPPEPKSSS